jgi:hypothetical protein
VNCDVTLTAEEFRQIHNALCFAHADGIQKTVETIRTALAGAYAQDDSAFDRKMSYFRRFQEENKFKAIWSIYKLDEHGFLKDHPYTSDAFVVYQGGHVPVCGATWGDVYRAADKAIFISGDDHHIFIEAFELRNGNELHLTTGS